MLAKRSVRGLCALGLLFVVYSLHAVVGQEQVAAPAPNTDAREAKLEFELNRLRNLAAGMGENHPHLKATQERISAVSAEIVALSRGAGPFAEALVAERADIDRWLEGMSDHDVRQAVLHLFGQVKDLQRRLDRIENKQKL